MRNIALGQLVAELSVLPFIPLRGRKRRRESLWLVLVRLPAKLIALALELIFPATRGRFFNADFCTILPKFFSACM